MPVSRSRKKKKNPKNPSKKDNRWQPDEVFEMDGRRIERRGKMTYMVNTKTEKEHREFLDSLPEGIANMNERINVSTARIIDIFKSYSKIALLGGLSANHYIKQADAEDDGMAEVILEYGLSVAAALPNASSVLPERSKIHELINILTELKQVVGTKYIAESALSRTTGQPEDDYTYELRFHTLMETLHVRGIGYYEHVKEMFFEMFSLHNTFLLEQYGFTAGDLIDTVEYIEKSWMLRLSKPEGIPDPELMMQFEDWALNQRKLPLMTPAALKEFYHQNPGTGAGHPHTEAYSINRIDQYEELFRIRFTDDKQKNVVNALSMNFGDNHTFIEQPSNGHLLGDTLIKTKPFIFDDSNNAYLFSYSLISRNFLAIGQSLLENAGDEKKYFNKYYRNKQHEVSRDRFVERKVESLFNRFLNNVRFVANTKYPLPNQKQGAKTEYTELDLLGIGNNFTYIIEVKAGELNEAGRRGAIDSLVSRLKKNVSEGDLQSKRAYNYIQHEEKPVFINGKEEILIDKSKPVFRIVVTLDNFAGLLVKASTLESANLLGTGADYPWVINIYDLMIFSELIESESDFTDYLQKRLALNSWKEFSLQDEVNLLGHFFTDNLIFKIRHKKLDNFMLDNYAQEIDGYFTARQRGFLADKPKRRKKG